MKHVMEFSSLELFTLWGSLSGDLADMLERKRKDVEDGEKYPEEDRKYLLGGESVVIDVMKRLVDRLDDEIKMELSRGSKADK